VGVNKHTFRENRIFADLVVLRHNDDGPEAVG
jgi:hypothetical protein